MKKKVIFFLSFLLLCMTGKILWNCENVPAAVEVTGNETAENIMKDLELDEVQKMLNEMMGEDSFSLKQMAADLIDGKEALSAETIQKFLRTVLFNGLENEKSLLLKLILLMFLAAVFANCAEVFGN